MIIMPRLHPFLSKDLTLLARDFNAGAAAAIQDTCEWMDKSCSIVWSPGDMRLAGAHGPNLLQCWHCCQPACSQALQD